MALNIRPPAPMVGSWLLGDKRYTWKGYVAEADSPLLSELVAVHGRLIDRRDATALILDMADHSPDPEAFVRELQAMAAQKDPS